MNPPPPSHTLALVLAILLGAIAVGLCGIPFIPPLVWPAIVFAGGSLYVVARDLLRRGPWSWGRALGSAVALALDALALYLALGHHHLIDWLEGH
ncbi:MAG TPA: hypothetical protein VGO11_25755 [Chthoniobacteraceae bacterium]|jgi:hypothetical protein|nr:hypothetical protein [Chthoniobacteraceae bacterium]